MPAGRLCTECSAELSPDVQGGLCTRCLLTLGLKVGSEAPNQPHESEVGNQKSKIENPKVRYFGDYELLEEIAHGGMGTVFKARQVSLNRLVALKLIRAGTLPTEELVKRFKAEAEAAASLSHPNIVPIYEIGEHQGQHYFSMGLIEGRNLHDALRKIRNPQSAIRNEREPPHVGCYAPREAAHLVATVARAVHYAHQRGVLHRDIKPSNILLDASGTPHLTDFGLAKLIEKESTLTHTNAVMGTPAYMSPEQARGETKDVTTAADVYGLGAVLYETLTGSPPFGGGTSMETIRQVIEQEPRRPSIFNPKIDRDLETVCLKCLEKEPSLRYATAQEVAHELDRFLRVEPIQARRASQPEKLWRWCRRKPAMAMAVAITMAAIAAAGVFTLQLRHIEHRRVSERRQAAMDNALLLTRSGNLDEAENAISVAELTGVPAGDLRLLRGQLAFHRGDHPEAIRHLEQAQLLSPNSAAINAILATAYDQVGEWNKSAQLVDRVAKLNPKTPEDYLFKGLLEAEWDPTQGLATLDKAVQLRPSPIVLLSRADARANLTDDNRDVAQAERASAEMDLVLELLPGNPTALAVSLMTRLAAASAFRDAGDRERCQKALARAASDYESLKQFQHLDAVGARIMYLRYMDDHDGMLEVLRHMNSSMSSMAFNNYAYAAELYARGEFDEAIRVTERNARTNAASLDYARGYILAEQTNGTELAFREFNRIWETQPPGWDALNVQTILRLLGRREEAVSMCRSIRQRFHWPMWRNGWYQRLLDYDCDLLDAEELLRVAGKSCWNRCEAHFHIAMNLLAEGRRQAARKHFRQAVALQIVYFYEDKWSRAFLARMEKDPDWPPWIPQEAQPSNPARV